MYARLLKYVPIFLVSAVAVTGCGDDNSPSPTSPSAFEAAMFTAEPAIIAPQFFHNPFCHQFRPFGARFTVVARPSHDVFVRMMRFHFVDRFGVRTVPTLLPVEMTPSAFPRNTGPVTIPTSNSVPFPGSTTIPIPGVSSFDPFLIPGGSFHTIPFFLQFGCGIPADGTVFVDFDLSDRRGRSSSTQVRVRVRD